MTDQLENDDWSFVLKLCSISSDSNETKKTSSGSSNDSPKPKTSDPAVVETKSSTTQSSLPNTERLYLSDTYLFSASTSIVSVTALENNKYGSHAIILLSTIFHPQGGGQPSDEGTIINENGNIIFNVKFTQSVGNVIEHIGTYQDMSKQLQIGDTVQLQVNPILRRLHARLHSAGHMIDISMHKLGYFERLKATKGYHFVDNPYVEFEGNLTDHEILKMPQELNEILKEVISNSIPTEIVHLDKQTAGTVCKCDTTNYPETVRVVYIGGMPCPCGGTHITNTNEVGNITVTKIKKKKNIIKISYEIST